MKAKVKVEGVEKRDGYYRIKYRYADMRVDFPLYASRQYGAIDELDALMQFVRTMTNVNYEVVTDD